MPFSKEILMGASAGGAAADPERISQSDFESYTDNGTYATWTYNGYAATGGNVLTLASPGSNDFKEHNTIKSGGFTGHSFIQFSCNGYGYNGFAIFNYTGTTESYLDGVSGGGVITRKNPADYNYLYSTQHTNDNNSTGTNVRGYWFYGTGSGYVEQYGQAHRFEVDGQFRYHGDANPFYFRIGRDDDDYVYYQGFYAGGNSAPDYDGTGFTVTDKHYYVAGSGISTSSTGARQVSGAIAFGYGNYDGGPVEIMKHIEIWTNGD